jgi:hypothetical protein
VPLAADAPDAVVAHGTAILNFLYNYPTPAGTIAAAEKQAWAGESNFEFIPEGWVPKRSIVGEGPAAVSNQAYKTGLADVANDFYARSVFAYQRSWVATSGQAAGTKPLLCTAGIALCMAIIIWEPASLTGLMAHVDEDQDPTSIIPALQQVFPGDRPLRVYFYGGKPGSSLENGHAADAATNKPETWGTRGNLKRLLGALYEYNAGLPRSRLSIETFDVIGRPHNSDVVFDTCNGNIYPVNVQGAPNDIMGYPLDSLFRYWKVEGFAEQYHPEIDGSKMAIAANNLRDGPAQSAATGTMVGQLRRIRCAWDGTPHGWGNFKNDSNALICRLIIQEAYRERNLPFPPEMNQLVANLMARDKPMRLEQSLKRWKAYKLTIEAGQAPSPLATSWAKRTLTWNLAEILRGMALQPAPTTAQLLMLFEARTTAWLAEDNSVPAVRWEGLH